MVRDDKRPLSAFRASAAARDRGRIALDPRREHGDFRGRRSLWPRFDGTAARRRRRPRWRFAASDRSAGFREIPVRRRIFSLGGGAGLGLGHPSPCLTIVIKEAKYNEDC